MRFLFDQNISHRILQLLPGQFSGSTSVKQEGRMSIVAYLLPQIKFPADFTDILIFALESKGGSAGDDFKNARIYGD